MVNLNAGCTIGQAAQLIKMAHEQDSNASTLAYDSSQGEYANVAAWWHAHRDGRVYGAKFPKFSYSNSPTGTKTRDNANLKIELSTNTTAGRDDYCSLNAFRVLEVNATIDDAGKPHVKAISGLDNRFKRDGSNGDVWIMHAPLYYKVEDTGTHLEFLISDTKYDGYTDFTGQLLTDGTRRSAILHAKYMGGLDSKSLPVSISGVKPARAFGCQNDLIDYAAKKGKGYAGRCTGDDFYVQMMLLIKWATKNSDVLGGCWGYTGQCAVTVAETGKTRVIVKTSDANGFLIGSTVNVGTDKERNNTGNSSAAEARTILSKTTIDASNTALNLDGAAFNTTTSCFVSTMPWKTGACDKVQGTDGRPQSGSANCQPFILQDIEMGNGAYETMHDIIVQATKDADGNTGHELIWRVGDTFKASKNSTVNYTQIGAYPDVPKANDNQWKYFTDVEIHGGMFIPSGTTATSTTGMCDAVIGNPIASQGLRQLRRLGNLWDGSICGLWAANLRNDLTSRWWNFCSRLSALGRTKL